MLSRLEESVALGVAVSKEIFSLTHVAILLIEEGKSLHLRKGCINCVVAVKSGAEMLLVQWPQDPLGELVIRDSGPGLDVEDRDSARWYVIMADQTPSDLIHQQEDASFSLLDF